MAEQPAHNDTVISFSVLSAKGKTETIEIQKDDPDLIAKDDRVINYKIVDNLRMQNEFIQFCSAKSDKLLTIILHDQHMTHYVFSFSI